MSDPITSAMCESGGLCPLHGNLRLPDCDVCVRLTHRETKMPARQNEKEDTVDDDFDYDEDDDNDDSPTKKKKGLIPLSIDPENVKLIEAENMLEISAALPNGLGTFSFKVHVPSHDSLQKAMADGLSVYFTQGVGKKDTKAALDTEITGAVRDAFGKLIEAKLMESESVINDLITTYLNCNVDSQGRVVLTSNDGDFSASLGSAVSKKFAHKGDLANVPKMKTSSGKNPTLLEYLIGQHLKKMVPEFMANLMKTYEDDIKTQIKNTMIAAFTPKSGE